jgi:ABC-type sugar transport system substrate-binding protein
MEHTRIKKLSRVLTLLLALVLLLAPFAQALTLDQARELLAEFYVDPIPEETLQQPTIEDIILALGDPYTQYMTPEEYAGFIGSMSDQVVVGIGITVEKADLGLVITGVFSDSSAARAGLAAGVDQVVITSCSCLSPQSPGYSVNQSRFSVSVVSTDAGGMYALKV